jgi:hypothetical protein
MVVSSLAKLSLLLFYHRMSQFRWLRTISVLAIMIMAVRLRCFTDADLFSEASSLTLVGLYLGCVSSAHVSVQSCGKRLGYPYHRRQLHPPRGSVHHHCCRKHLHGCGVDRTAYPDGVSPSDAFHPESGSVYHLHNRLLVSFEDLTTVALHSQLTPQRTLITSVVRLKLLLPTLTDPDLPVC